jgi:hypothetical protein
VAAGRNFAFEIEHIYESIETGQSKSLIDVKSPLHSLWERQAPSGVNE